MAQLFMEGMLLQASLIFALGAQNLFVLESGMRRQFHLTVSIVCFLCDLTLILLGVAGAATLFTQFPGLKVFVGIVGVVFLFQYGLSKIFIAPPLNEETEVLSHKKNLKRSVLLAVSFSVLNPHAYLDAFVLIGGFSSKYEILSDRLALGFGAAIFSGIWFLLLSSASSFMKPLLKNPRIMRQVMSVAGFLLVMLSGKLGLEVWAWMDFSPMENHFVMKSFMDYPSPNGQVFTSILF